MKCLVLLVNLIIGIVRGFYPAQKAIKVSALDTLRYE